MAHGAGSICLAFVLARVGVRSEEGDWRKSGLKNRFPSPKERATVRNELEWTEQMDRGPRTHVRRTDYPDRLIATRRMGSKILRASTKNAEWDRKAPERPDRAGIALIVARRDPIILG